MEARWISAGEVRPLAADDLPGIATWTDGLLWIDFDHSEPDGMVLLSDVFKFEPASIEECHTRRPVPKLQRYSAYTFTAINGVARGRDGILHFQPLKVFTAPARLVTVLGPTHDALGYEAAHRELALIGARVDSGAFRPTTSVELGIEIRKVMLEGQEDLVSSAASRIAAIERRVMECDPVKSEDLLGELFQVRHDLQTIRTTAAQTRELLALVETTSVTLNVDVPSVHDLRQGFEHLTNTTDLEREYLQEVLDLFQTRASTELNRFIRKITAWGAIGVAGTLIAGIYGMNFAHMPELDWQYGYPMALGMIVLVGIVLMVVFRKRGWL
jgi:magnesium transporter